MFLTVTFTSLSGSDNENSESAALKFTSCFPLTHLTFRYSLVDSAIKCLFTCMLLISSAGLTSFLTVPHFRAEHFTASNHPSSHAVCTTRKPDPSGELLTLLQTFNRLELRRKLHTMNQTPFALGLSPDLAGQLTLPQTRK